MRKLTKTTARTASYNRRNRGVCLLLAVCMLVAPILVLRTDATMELTPITNNAQAEQVINFYAALYETTYTIADTKVLKSLSGGDDAYTLYTLNPYGYAILLNETNALMQACYVPDSAAPIDVTSDEVIYYGGPYSFFTKSGDTYTDVSGEYTVTAAELDLENSAEANVRANEAARMAAATQNTTQASVLSTNATVETVSVMNFYFSTLTEVGTNSNGTCSVLATAMLLGFYDYFYCDHYVASIHENGKGTNQAFHLHLNEYVYGVAQPGQGRSSFYVNQDKINDYLTDQAITANYICFDSGTAAAITELIIYYLNAGKPVTVSTMENSSDDYGHAVVVYGVTYDTSDPTGTAVCTAHVGPDKRGVSTEDCAVSLNPAWFFECAFIECGYTSHTACNPFTYFSGTQCKSHCECGALILKNHNPNSAGNCSYCGTYIEDE